MTTVQRILIALHEGGGPSAFAALHDATEEAGTTAVHPAPTLLRPHDRDDARTGRPSYPRLCFLLRGRLEYATAARRPA